MSTPEISEPIRRFIGDHIGSIAELELLLLLRKHTQRQWTAREAAAELRVEVSWTQRQFQDLHGRSLLTLEDTPEPRYRYGPASPEQDRLVATLEQLYAERRVTVVTLIYARPRDHLRSFAEAFRLREDK